MALYLHIPFCKQACYYCDFHFTTSVRYRDRMVEALVSEMQMRRSFLLAEKIHSVYLGGGTPSLLAEAELERLLGTVRELFDVDDRAEVTLEANPDDLSYDKLRFLRKQGINRLSIGIQSFREEDLQWMNRAHNSHQAKMALRNAFEAGFENVTIDLIYGIPGTGDREWLNNLETAFQFPINHLSAYALTVEPRTALAHFIKKDKYPAPDDEATIRQYDLLMDFMEERSWVHYEISNFALAGNESRHNSAYWKGLPYLGIGPSAHSFDGSRRYWNVANNQTYMKSIEAGHIPARSELLSVKDQYNEYVMTGLRTIQGCSPEEIQKRFGKTYLELFLNESKSGMQSGLIVEQNGKYVLTRKGKHLADGVIADLLAV